MARLYNLLLALFLPFVMLRLFWRGRSQPEYRQHWRERLALVSLPRADIWLHAVSVGEVKVALYFLEQLAQQDWQDKSTRILISCTTPTGRAAVAKWQKYRQDLVHCYYLPYDLRSCMSRAVRQVQPSILLLFETEIWPNLIHCAKVAEINIVLVNARMSKKSARGYSKIIKFIKPSFAAFDLVIAQTRADATRLKFLGVQKCQIATNLKFDYPINYNVAKLTVLRQRLAKRSFVLAIGSSRFGEEQFLIPAIDELLQQRQEALVLWAPRHIELSRSIITNGLAKLGYKIDLFSDDKFDTTSRIILIDTFGDMTLMYALADCVFIGGTLVDTGSQNLIEPALLGKPIISGPSHFNFKLAHKVAKESGGLLCVEDQDSLNRTLLAITSDAKRAKLLGKRVHQAISRCQGGTAKTLLHIKPLLSGKTFDS